MQDSITICSESPALNSADGNTVRVTALDGDTPCVTAPVTFTPIPEAFLPGPVFVCGGGVAVSKNTGDRGSLQRQGVQKALIAGP